MKLLGREIGIDQPLFLIAGPCVIESEALCLTVAEELRRLAERTGILVVFKASFDKANRSSARSYRGLGMDEGLRVLDKVRAATGLPVITDVHEAAHVPAVSEVVDMLQTPAFLARQTDLIMAAAASGRPVNIKKAQFMAPLDMVQVIDKARTAALAAGVDADSLLVCERGTMFGYGNLVVDMRSLVQMRETRCPVVFDATHSVQLPGVNGTSSGGQREFVEPLARAAIAVGVAGIFMETHPDPASALSDGPNAIALADLPALIDRLLALRGDSTRGLSGSAPNPIPEHGAE
ncbi:3-deoxy-8-phosphooctulonate synthase [Novosphingobium sp. PASSN1]|uniref:3-deoxy-8-phosphooctulonate synthase n=1 Tax=Novosphingobium sp. PASSN1 TaxID=2015561 RepID=UPI000BD56B57|nr:3-deoxy-8-phosphooctulonate synthase [Novosphingobium sp. PASSN1]OYU33109.1 MAG: 3-deoxy-8-phosphooctulonate synthase [Novosphingobium sp. PASSN1]OYU33834.1 MAG: 3-deoxy-8-phosphooctulonate synthase [Novosphingobium sp. PASSN1]